MLLMFAVGVGSIGWMLVLAAVMATEKNVPWGRRLSAPLGSVLIGGGLALAVAGTLGVGALMTEAPATARQDAEDAFLDAAERLLVEVGYAGDHDAPAGAGGRR